MNTHTTATIASGSSITAAKFALSADGTKMNANSNASDAPNDSLPRLLNRIDEAKNADGIANRMATLVTTMRFNCVGPLEPKPLARHTIEGKIAVISESKHRTSLQFREPAIGVCANE
jgi:hypothetical protein